jgi:hypothetical protein
MEMQQIIEMLLTNQAKLDADREEMTARMDANTKAMREDMKTMQERAVAERKSDREEMKQIIRAGQEQLQENLKRMMEEMMNANQAKIDVKLEELSEANDKTHVEHEEPTSADRKACQETTVCHEATEADIEKIDYNPRMMQSVVECQEVPKEDAIAKSVERRKKRHRGQKQAAGRRGEPKELTRGDCRSWKKLAAACRKVSHHATVAWCKRNLLRKSWTHGNWPPAET